MIYDIATIKEKLVSNHHNKFSDPTKFPNCRLSDVADIFLQLIEYKKLPELTEALHIFYVEDQCSRLGIARDFFAKHFEAYLKAVFQIVHNEEVTGSLRACLKRFFADIGYELPKADEKNQQDVFFANPGKDERYESNCPAHFRNEPSLGFVLPALKVAYELRNAVAHHKTAIEYFDAEPKMIADKRHWFGDIEDCILAYLFVTYKYFEKLLRFLEPDMTRYLESVKLEFETERLRFVHIRGVFEDIIHVKSHPKVSYTQEFIPELSDDETVATLRGKISGRKMLVTGDAGMGKTTTLHYLAAEDADKLLNDYSLLSIGHPLPVYVELKDIKDDEANGRKIEVTVRDLIFRQVKYGMGALAKSEEEKLERYLDKLLNEGKITLFLDGLNEIPKEDKAIKQSLINQFLKQFDKVFFLLTSRKSDYKGVVPNDIPVFELQKMDVLRIKNFVEKNTENPQVVTLINRFVTENRKNDSFMDFIGVPLLLLALINVVEQKREVPRTRGELIRNFIDQMYDWQCRKSSDSQFDSNMSKKLDSLLCHLAMKIKELYDTNPHLAYGTIIEIFQERNQKLGLRIDPSFALKIAVELHILVEKKHKYVFVHQLFLQFYAAEELANEVEDSDF